MEDDTSRNNTSRVRKSGGSGGAGQFQVDTSGDRMKWFEANVKNIKRVTTHERHATERLEHRNNHKWMASTAHLQSNATERHKRRTKIQMDGKHSGFAETRDGKVRAQK